MASSCPALSVSVELPATYSALSYENAAESDSVANTLQPLGAACELIEERNVLRRRLRQLEEELDAQKKLTQVYGAHLHELIQRVKTLGKSKSAELLTGIQFPRRENTSAVLSDMLRDVGILHSGEFSAALPLINSYLDRAILKAKRAAKMYESLEMSANPLIADAWKQVDERLSTRVESCDSLISEIRVKAEVLSAVKSIETASLEEALRSAQKVQAVLEDMVLESESWVVCEALHGRVQPDEKLEEMIRKRLSLMAEPFTLEVVRDLAELFAEYEYLRKSAALKPWADRIHSEGEWWRLVSLCIRLAHASELTLGRITSTTPTDLSTLIASLRCEVNIDSEGAYTFSTVILEQLVKVERLKVAHLEASNTSETRALRKAAKDLSTECLNLACCVAAWTGQPLQNWHKLRHEVQTSENNIAIASRVVAAARRLQSSEKVETGVEAVWTLPVLEKCWEATSELQGADTIRKEIQRIKSKKDCQPDHKRNVAAPHTPGTPRESQSSHATSSSTVTDALTALSLCCSNLRADANPQAQSWAEDCLSRLSSSLSLEDKVRVMESAIAGLPPLLQQPTAQEALDSTHTAASEQELSELVSLAASVSEIVEKPLYEGKQGLQDQSGAREKLEFLRSVLQGLKDWGGTQKAVLASRLQGMIEHSALATERLADSGSNSEHKKVVKESLRQLRAEAEEVKVELLVEALERVLALERQQTDALQCEQFAAGETTDAPKSPLSPQSSAPAPLSKEESVCQTNEGLHVLVQALGPLRTDLRVRFDEDEQSRRLQSIESANSETALLLQESFIHWEIEAIQSSVANTHRRLLEKTIMSLEQIAELKGSSQSQILATVQKLKEDQETSRWPLLRLLEDAQDAVNQELPAIAGATFASDEIWTAIQQLVHIYETELQSHNVQLTISEQEETKITSSDSQTRAHAFLKLLGNGMKAFSRKMRQAALEGKAAQRVAESALQNLELTIACLSQPEWERYRRAKVDGDAWKDIENASSRLRRAAESALDRAKESGQCSALGDLQSSFAAPFERHSAPNTPARTRLQSSLPPALDSISTAVLQATLRLLELNSVSHQLAIGKDKVQTASAQTKLEFVRDAITSLLSTQVQALLPIVEDLKNLLSAAANRLPDENQKMQIANLISSVSSRVDSHKSDAKECAESLLSALSSTLQAVHAQNLSDSAQPGLDSHFRSVRKLAAVLGAQLDQQTEEQISRSLKVEGGAKTLLQQSALQAALRGLLKSVADNCRKLIASMLGNVRTLGKVSGAESDLEQLLASIEKDAEEDGANFTLVFNVSEIVNCLLSDTSQPSNGECLE